MKMFFNENLGLWECKCPLCGARCLGNDYIAEANGKISDTAFFGCVNCPVAKSQGKLSRWGWYSFEVKKEKQMELFE